MEFTARQCMLLCKLIDESRLERSLLPEYIEIMDIVLVERDNQRKIEEEQ